MAAHPKIHSVDEVRRWYEAGLTYQEMADLHFIKYGVRVTLGAFSTLRRRRGWPPRLATDNPLIPWKVKLEHQGEYAGLMLHRENRRRQGFPWLSKDPESQLDGWIEGLRSRGMVIDYDPDSKRGFISVPARRGIDTDLIRVPANAL